MESSLSLIKEIVTVGYKIYKQHKKVVQLKDKCNKIEGSVKRLVTELESKQSSQTYDESLLQDISKCLSRIEKVIQKCTKPPGAIAKIKGLVNANDLRDELDEEFELLHQFLIQVLFYRQSTRTEHTENIGNYAIVGVCGRGSFGVVYKAKRSDKVFAVKKLNTTNLEIYTKLSLLHSDFIVNILDVKFKPKPFIVMEYCEDGNLNQYTILTDPNLEEELKLMQGMAAGVAYLHQNDIIHRDLKPENILLSRKGKELIAKLADFGLSVFDNRKFRSTICGTPPYMAPEIIMGIYNSSVDTYALGCVYFAFHGRKLLQSEFEEQILAPVLDTNKEPYTYLSQLEPTITQSYFIKSYMAGNQELGQLVYRMISRDATRRPNIQLVKDQLDHLEPEKLSNTWSGDEGAASEKMMSQKSNSKSQPQATKTVSDTVSVTVYSVTLFADTDVMKDESIQRFFVEYRFLGVPLEELETPFSLPKPAPDQPIVFNFRKVFHVDFTENYERRQYLASMLLPDDPDQGRIKFTLVSEPSEDNPDVDCEDFANASVDVKEILKRKNDLVDTDVPLYDADGDVEVGSINLTVKCLAALTAVQKEIT